MLPNCCLCLQRATTFASFGQPPLPMASTSASHLVWQHRATNCHCAAFAACIWAWSLLAYTVWPCLPTCSLHMLLQILVLTISPMGPESLPGPGPHQRPDSSGNMNNPSLLGQGVGHDSSSTMHHGMPSGMNSQHRPPVSRTNSRDSFTGGSGGMHQNSNNFGRFGSQQQESFSMDGMQNVMPPNQTAPMQKSMSQLHLSGGGQQQNPFELDPMQVQ